MKELFGLFLRPLSRFQIRLKSNLSMKTTDILALDFDGVVCASSPESSYSSIVAAKQVWPSSFTNVEIADPTSYSSLQEVIMYLRPIIETGYENMLIARYLHESKRKGSDVELEWNPSFRDQLISNYGIPKVCSMLFNTNFTDRIKLKIQN